MIAPDNAAEASTAPERRSSNRPGVWLALAALPVLSLLPFVTKPFNIDDVFYLAVAKHIVKSPLDFYGFEFNWYGTLEQVTYANHAPASAYYMALIGSIAGWSEIAMHAAFMVPAIGLISGTYAVARQFCDRPAWASVIAWFCPAVLVSATSVMTDIWMAAFFVWAVALWIRGIDESSIRFLCAAAVAASMAGLMKYFGVTVIGLFALYAFGRRHPLQRWTPLLPIPILVLAGYEALTYAMYGQGLVSSTFDFADKGRSTADTAWYEWIVNGLSFTGGGLAAAALVCLFGWPRRIAFVWCAMFAILAASLSFAEWQGGSAEGNSDLSAAIHLAAFITLGAHLLAYTVWRLVRERKLEELLLAAWIAGIFVFSTYVNWSVTARTLVPMAPAVGILAMRAVQHNDSRKIWRYGATLVAAALTLFVAWGDMSWSRTVRNSAAMFNDSFRGWPTNVYFQGHWGFQHYADPEVMQPLDVERTVLHAGDILITPKNNSVGARLPERFRARSDVVLAGEGRWASTMLGRAGAGFYSNLFGPLPFRLGPAPPEMIFVTEVSPAIEELNNTP